MKVVLLSGGAGKRLFPLSNDVRAKQFLRLFKGENGERISMLQRVWNQLQKAGLGNSAYISTNSSQVEIIQSQLENDISLIVEPELRDTFPGISLVSAYLHSKEKVDRDEVVCIAPVDPFVDDEYFFKLKDLEQSLLQSDANIGLLGVKPYEPSEKFGYIIPSTKGNKNHYEVKSFSEKPSMDKAVQLVNQGAYWNCGVFAFRLGYMLDVLKQKQIPADFDTLTKVYATLKKKSFDYEVLESEKKIIVVPYEGKWKDLGTWESLTEEMDTEILGSGFMDHSSQNTHIINELGIPFAVLGLEDSVAVASPDGILVSKKPTSARIKELIQFEDRRPMYEERAWGWYRVLDYEKRSDGREVLTKRISVLKGKHLSYQVHKKRDEIWTIISGSGEFVFNDQYTEISTGDVVKIRSGDMHALKAREDLEIIEVQTGSELIEEDIERICVTWEEIEDRLRILSNYQTDAYQNSTEIFKQ